MVVADINSLDEFRTLINGDESVAIDFWAPWCAPCKAISPIFSKLADTTESIKFYKVNIDDQPDIAQEVGIRGIPTFQLYKGGEKIDELIGASPGGLQTLIQKGSSD